MTFLEYKEVMIMDARRTHDADEPAIDAEPTDDGSQYLHRRPDAIPVGKVVVHNHVVPEWPDGTRKVHGYGIHGSRSWIQDPDPAKLAACGCGWEPEFGVHYHVRATVPEGSTLLPGA